MARDGKDYKQDMLVSIRYRNDLPPPPMPPKLLEIPHTGLSSYLDPGLAASLARREPPNIEADAEGGMPIDVIGMYGYFEDDENSIMMPQIPPAIDPADEALMLTYDQLKSGGKAIDSGFLLKASQLAATGPMSLGSGSRPAKRQKFTPSKQAPVARDDKENIKRSITKAFEIAYPTGDTTNTSLTAADRSAWTNPVHPSGNKSIRPVSFYPIIPDLSLGGQCSIMRFDRHPLPAHNGKRDSRLDAAFIGYSRNEVDMADYDTRMQAHENEPDIYEHPGHPPIIFSLYVPKDADATGPIRTLLNVDHPDHDDPSLLSAVAESSPSEQMRIPLHRAKVYPSYKNEIKEDKSRQIVISMHDPSKTYDGSTKSRTQQGPAAYYYPLSAVTRLKADRGRLAMHGNTDRDLEEGLIDQVLLLPKEANAMENEVLFNERAQFDDTYQEEYKRIQAAAEALRQEMERPQEEAQKNTEDQTHESDDAVQHEDTDAANTDVAGVTLGDPEAQSEAKLMTGGGGDEVDMADTPLNPGMQ